MSLRAYSILFLFFSLLYIMDKDDLSIHQALNHPALFAASRAFIIIYLLTRRINNKCRWSIGIIIEEFVHICIQTDARTLRRFHLWQ